MNDEMKGTEIVETRQDQISLGQLMFTDPAAMMAQAKIVATTLKGFIKDQGLVSNISGREYVVVEGWTTMGAMIGVIPRTVSVEELVIEYQGSDWPVFEATVELVRTSDGFVVGRGIAECGHPDEVDRNGDPVWANRARYAKKSMAITRATGKAFRLSYSWIIKMAGYSPTPAEEMDGVINGEFVKDKKPVQKKKKPAPVQKQEEPKLTAAEMNAIKRLGQDEPDLCPSGWMDWETAYNYVDATKGVERKEFVKMVGEKAKGDVRLGMCYQLGYLKV